MQIHLYKNNGYNMILDVPGGSVHVADELMYEAAALMAETGDEEQVRQELLHRFCPASGTDPGNVTATPEEIDEVLEENQWWWHCRICNNKWDPVTKK